MRHPRFFPGPNRPTEVVRKCTEGRFLLKPDAQLRERVIGVYARAQEVTGMTVFAAVALSNHTHELIAPSSANQRTEWLRHIGTNLSKLIKSYRGWRPPVFTERAAVIPCTEEVAAWVDRLRYILAHGMKEGLVPHPGLWLGMQCVEALCAGKMELEGIWCDRVGYRRALAAWRRECARLAVTGRRNHNPRPRVETFERSVSLKLSKLPGQEHLGDAEYGAWVRGLVDELLETYAEERSSVPEDWKSLLDQTAADHRPQEKLQRVVPRCHAASRAAREAMRKDWLGWVRAYVEASIRLRAGAVSALWQFPEGAILPPVGNAFEGTGALARQ